MKKISICIPTWEQYGAGANFFDKLLSTIEIQSYKNFEVIVSDHSENQEILNICKKYLNKFQLIYKKNEISRGNGPANTNNCLNFVNGDIIKIMFQDDYFYDEFSLEKINNYFEINNCTWLVNGCNHTDKDGENYYNTMSPSWNDQIIFGRNTISSPSVLSFLSQVEIKFDENLVMLMDCDFYYSLYKQYGLPCIINDCLVTNRSHNFQISKKYNMENFGLEINYIKSKHNL